MNNKLFSQLQITTFIIAILLPISLFANAENPKQIIQTMSEQFEEEMIKRQKEIKDNSEITDELIGQYLVPNVNFLLMSRYVLGKNWNKATTEQQQEFIGLFKSLLIRFYSKAFVDYLKKNKIEKGLISMLPYREKSGSKYAKVKTEIKLNNGSSNILVKYTLYKSKTKGWKIYDVSVEGVSLVTSYRSSFKQIIEKEKMSGLISHLKKKVNKSS